MIIAKVNRAVKDKAGVDVTMFGSCDDLVNELEAILVGLVRNRDTIELVMHVLNHVSDMTENNEI